MFKLEAEEAKTEATSQETPETEEELNTRLLLEQDTISKHALNIFINTKDYQDLNNFIKPLVPQDQQVMEDLIYIVGELDRNTSVLQSLQTIYTILIPRQDPALEGVLGTTMEFIKDMSILVMMNKYSCTGEEAEARILAMDHYENIINNDPKLRELYFDMKNYFDKEVLDRKLTKGNLKVRKEHFFHDENNSIDNTDSFHIVFQINKNCNFKCTYCYEGLDKVTEILSIDDVPDIVQGIKEFQEHLVRKNNALPEEERRGTAISFSILGGEPTLVPQEVTQLLTKLLNQELDLKYIILITNNYSSKKTINFFHPDYPKGKMKIQISYDGGVIQDEYRLTHAKKSSRELVVKETRKLLNQGIRVTMKATLPPEAMKNVPDAVQDYLTLEEEINVNNGSGQNFSYYPTMDTTSFLMTNLRMNILAGKEEEKNALFQDIHESFKVILKLELDRLLDGDNAFTRWFREISFLAKNTRCSAGVNLFGLDQDGEARYCHRTEYDSKSHFKDYSKLEYGNVMPKHGKENPFIGKFESTRKEILDIPEDKMKEISNCTNCKTLSCVKCPMINIGPSRALDTNTSGNMFMDMQSNSMNLTCELNNTISIYLYMYSKIIKV